ncbi:MAG: FAD-binding oxidoreductase, partial [Microcoleus sp. Co-bin12]|nr:FAD-binding oxidoreductase [Microcoleus sp. Co-bin12]
MSLTEKILSQLPADALGGLRKVDRLWENLKQNTAPTPQAVKHSQQPLETLDFDIVIGGGTLGILIGTALAVRGWRVALLERGTLRGRDQEWNISRKELDAFLELNLLSVEEIEKAIATEYNPARISFANTPDIWVRDVLNIGIDPVYLLETFKQRFLQAGGKLFENTPFKIATIHPDGVIVESENTDLQFAKNLFKTRLFLDAMGHFSPIVRQA